MCSNLGHRVVHIHGQRLPGDAFQRRLGVEAHERRQMWLDNAVSVENIEPDYRALVQQFVLQGQEHAALRFFVAEREGRCVGAACCQLFVGLYPAILLREVRRYGYIWGVYVAPTERRQGLGHTLTETCGQSLRSQGCTHALLHAAPPGRAIYERLGFQGTNEMRLTL
ncbi:MAG: GNAT family N-acetyltransferase [Deltaproteobacteria bacterium]